MDLANGATPTNANGSEPVGVPRREDLADMIGGIMGDLAAHGGTPKGYTEEPDACEDEDAVLERLQRDNGIDSPVIPIASSLRYLPQQLGIGKSVPSPQQPGEVAELLLLLLAIEGTHLKHWRGSWYVWREGLTGGRYRPLAGTDDRRGVHDMVRMILKKAKYEYSTKDTLELRPWNPTVRSVNEVAEALAAYSRLGDGMRSGTWIDARNAAENEQTAPGSEITAVANGLLRSPRFGGAEARILLPHTPGFFTDSCVAVPYEADAECPRWMQFLEELWPGDPDSQLLLQEWFGYVLTGSTALQKILTLVGAPRCGKGTISWVIQQLLGGKDEIASPSMASLGGRFGLEPMLGKPLAIIGDARVSKSAVPEIVEKLLMISGEDPVIVDRKGVHAITVKLDTRIMLLSNEAPDLRDITGAMASRFLPLEITVKGWLGREDIHLRDKLGRELSGILRWALEGADRLWANGGRFTIGTTVKESMEKAERQGSPVKAFAMDCLTLDPVAVSLKDPIYDAYAYWCADSGFMPKGKNVFFRDLVAAYPGDLSLGRNTVDGKQQTTLRGAQLA